MSRYINKITAINDLDIYKKTLEKRGVLRIEQYRTPSLKQFETSELDFIEKVWMDGDSFWKLSDEFYGDPKHWYLIARFNSAPTEAHIKIGDTIKIPINLSAVLQVVER